jgi:hypothetical protein
MNIERSKMIEAIRSEVVGPSRPKVPASLIVFEGNSHIYEGKYLDGPKTWTVSDSEFPQEVLHYNRESPHRNYGAGQLHPPGEKTIDAVSRAAAATNEKEDDLENPNSPNDGKIAPVFLESDGQDDFEVTSPDQRLNSTMGMSFRVRLRTDGIIRISLPKTVLFNWQQKTAIPFDVNGWYEACKVQSVEKSEASEAWRRRPAVSADSYVEIKSSDFVDRKVISQDIKVANGCPINLIAQIYPRKHNDGDGCWLITVVVRNATKLLPSLTEKEKKQRILFQSYYQISISGGDFITYPESQRPFEHLDKDEQSLALLYRDSGTYAIGHNCAAAWDSFPGQSPKFIYADIMPAVQLPSMTPDIEINGVKLEIPIRDLDELSSDGSGVGWEMLSKLSSGYRNWIISERNKVNALPEKYKDIANSHLDKCEMCADRIDRGIELLKTDSSVLSAFKLTNKAMLLQQISTKGIKKRGLIYNPELKKISPEGEYISPAKLYDKRIDVGPDKKFGKWRAFQIAFLVMSLEGVTKPESDDREIVDLIWFPTGGGKTEAYLGVMAYCMFYGRSNFGHDTLPADGTVAMMRYTLRMLTTQQFQRASSLICAMEYIRREQGSYNIIISGGPFSIGLWLGGEASPNKIDDATAALSKFRSGEIEGNPMVLTECPWCRSTIGRFNGVIPSTAARNRTAWERLRLVGITTRASDDCPRLHCPDSACSFGQEDELSWLPVEVIDEVIYKTPPSLVIATADKLAMFAYRPQAGALFGFKMVDGRQTQVSAPPSLIIQDELHLISGPLGTMYALYEGIFEKLSEYNIGGKIIKPKIIASTATIRAADKQVMALYARPDVQLFPSPGLDMSDSFFGRYATSEDGSLSEGRLYLGLFGSDYGSILTTQTRAFASALYAPHFFEKATQKDPWWTLLAFYNSIRELGGAKTLFDADIRSRLKYLFNREGIPSENRRHLRIVEELTSRLTQPEIVGMLEKLNTSLESNPEACFDACLASNIIEVGVDIDRLSIMAVIGQPKTTSSYIQITGRVGRRWWDRPGLILTVYNPGKSRDRSHYEQFHSYHRRLYERVEPTTATPFALSAIKRAAAGVFLTWVRQFHTDLHKHEDIIDEASHACDLLIERCRLILDENNEDFERSKSQLEQVFNLFKNKLLSNPQKWEEFPPTPGISYLMLWPGQYYSNGQKNGGFEVPTSMRQVDTTSEFKIPDNPQ